MGGLLAAEAATSPIHVVSRRVVGLLAFDVPFLGMHPHVVVSGIASLLPHHKKEMEGQGGVKGGGSHLKTETEMNDARHVDITFEVQSNCESGFIPVCYTRYSMSLFSAASSSASHVSLSSPPPNPSSISSSPSLAPPPLPPRPSSKNQILPGDTQASSSLHKPDIVSRTLDFIQSHADDRLVHFIAKHRSEPIAAARRWVVESLEFGICIFDPKGLRDRYAALERWPGRWVAFWTETVPHDKEAHETQRQETAALEVGVRADTQGGSSSPERIAEVVSTMSLSSQLTQSSLSISPSFELEADTPLSGSMTEAEDKSAHRQAMNEPKKHDKELKADQRHREAGLKAMQKERKPNSPHHFVVRPFREPSGMKHRWEKVKIRGAKDEVEAHCGLFIRDINPAYDDFVRRVAEIAKEWVDTVAA